MPKFAKNSNVLAILVLFSIIIFACTKETRNPIPDVEVDFTLDLDNPEFANLTNAGSFDTIDATTHNLGSLAAGYDGNGIIVYTGPDEFHAYDRTCPHDFANNGLSIKIKVTYSLAVCPICGTVYDLAAFGTPVSGPGRYPLKNYSTSLSYNRYLRVWNK
jgi:nitrite reductase/ring-hydroxylating ferredoxin subunit